MGAWTCFIHCIFFSEEKNTSKPKDIIESRANMKTIVDIILLKKINVFLLYRSSTENLVLGFAC